MKARKWIIGMVIIIAMAWTTAGTAWAGHRSERRQHRQTNRIYLGVRNGTISLQEFKRLGREQFRIEEAKRRALEDGHISRYERRHLKRMQNRAGKRIFRAKHTGLGIRHGPHDVRRRHARRDGTIVRGHIRWSD